MRSRANLIFSIALICFVLLIFILSLRRQKEVFDEKDQRIKDLESQLEEAGNTIFECAQDLEKSQGICTQKGLEFVKRGNLIFECEQRICEVNGWIAPPDWEEQGSEYESKKVH